MRALLIPPAPTTPDASHGSGVVVYSGLMEHTHGAPAFDPERNDYPLSGEKVGPIWRLAWSYLALEPPGAYVSAQDVITYVQLQLPDAHTETIRNLLYAAVRAGILESETRTTGKPARARTHFRIKP